jgi:hypothetical protein
MEKYNNWTVLSYCERKKNERQKVFCQCICGEIKVRELKFLKSGRTNSCGCYKTGFKKEVITDQMIIEKYMGLKAISKVGLFFKKRHSYISKVLKDNNVKLYIGNFIDPEIKRKKKVNKVINYKKRRVKRDPLFKCICSIRNTLSQSFNRMGYTKKSKTFEILGIEWDGFKLYIENKFREGMSWDNYGEWEYDHIVAVSNGKTEQEVIKLNHYTNFQPLWWKENNLKSNN